MLTSMFVLMAVAALLLLQISSRLGRIADCLEKQETERDLAR